MPADGLVGHGEANDRLIAETFDGGPIVGGSYAMLAR